MSSNSQSVILSEQDYDRLTKFLRLQGFKSSALLAEKLATAELRPQKEIPDDLVTMNSVVEFVDVETGKKHQVSLEYPFSSGVTENRISILSPLGVEILGLRIGDSISWPTPTGRRKPYQVLRLIFQPEAAGKWDL